MTGELLNTGYAALEEQGGKYIARGMALGAGDVTNGGSGKETLWPKEILQDAAEGLAGQPLATSTDHTADGPQTQTPPEAIVGEVTWADFGEVDGKEGVLYEAEVDDPDIARNIENGRIEVSPLVFRELKEHDGDEADYQVTEIKKWRDLATVRRGASPSASIEPGEAAAMSAEALFDTVESMQDTSNEAAESAADANDGPSDDGDNPSSSVADNEEPDMSNEDNDLTAEEKAVLSAAESLESPAEALEDYAAAEQPSIVDEETTVVVPTDEYEALQDQVGEMESIMGEALAERTDLKESTIEALSFEALCDEFRDEEGDLQVEALVQEPETEEPESEPESGVEALSEDADVDKAEALYGDYQMMNNPPEGLEDDIVEALCVDDFDAATEVLD